jgi:hypothetical protein
LTLAGLETGSNNNVLELVGGHGSTLSLDLDVLLGAASHQTAAAMPEVHMPDRMDLFSGLLHDTLVHDDPSSATPTPGVEHAVHADVFANASEAALHHETVQPV